MVGSYAAGDAEEGGEEAKAFVSVNWLLTEDHLDLETELVGGKGGRGRGARELKGGGEGLTRVELARDGRGEQVSGGFRTWDRSVEFHSASGWVQAPCRGAWPLRHSRVANLCPPFANLPASPPLAPCLPCAPSSSCRRSAS